jgi:hypothetical protein
VAFFRCLPQVRVSTTLKGNALLYAVDVSNLPGFPRIYPLVQEQAVLIGPSKYYISAVRFPGLDLSCKILRETSCDLDDTHRLAQAWGLLNHDGLETCILRSKTGHKLVTEYLRITDQQLKLIRTANKIMELGKGRVKGYGIRPRQVPLPGLSIGPCGMMAQLTRRPDHYLPLRKGYGLWVSLSMHYRSNIIRVRISPGGLLSTGITVRGKPQGKASTIQYPKAFRGALIELGINKVVLEKLLQLRQVHWVRRAVKDCWRVGVWLEAVLLSLACEINRLPRVNRQNKRPSVLTSRSAIPQAVNDVLNSSADLGPMG